MDKRVAPSTKVHLSYRLFPLWLTYCNQEFHFQVWLASIYIHVFILVTFCIPNKISVDIVARKSCKKKKIGHFEYRTALLDIKERNLKHLLLLSMLDRISTLQVKLPFLDTIHKLINLLPV